MKKSVALISAFALVAASNFAFAAEANAPQDTATQGGSLPPPAKPVVKPKTNLFPAAGGIAAAVVGGVAAGTSSESP